MIMWLVELKIKYIIFSIISLIIILRRFKQRFHLFNYEYLSEKTTEIRGFLLTIESSTACWGG